MIRTLRAFFLSRALREKLLLVAFCAIGVVIWAANLSDRASRFWHAQSGTTLNLKGQDKYLNDQAKIEAAATKAGSLLVPEKTLGDLGLFTTIQQLAAEAGLTNKLKADPMPGFASGQGSIHQLRVTLNNADWEPLTKFYTSLLARSPYIALGSTQLVPNRTNPAQVTFLATVSSIEIAH